MPPDQSSEKELVKKLLEPLLEDFQYWFEGARSLLESEQLSFLSSEEQAELLHRVKQAKLEVSPASLLYQATGGEAGIETSMLLQWHKLVAECWQVKMRWHRLKNSELS